MRAGRVWWIPLAAGILVGACGGPEGSASPIAEPNVACIGVPQGPCDDAVASLAGSVVQPVVQVTVACTIAVCTATEGALQMDVLFADGRRETRGSGYGAAEEPVPVEPPILTVVPVCLGVPFAECRDMAQSAAGSGAVGGGPPIARITVRCKGVCTPAKGEGETRVDYVDGTSLTSGWGYESSGG